MANFRLRDPDCVLIHIPKTGGSSIRKGSWRERYDPPTFGNIPDDWMGLFKFAFVRHPLQRLISAWKMFTDGPMGAPQWRLPADARPLTIEEFVDVVLDENILFDERRKTFEEKIRHHTIPQTHPFNCLHLADFVGRYESLESDFQLVARHVGLKNSDLPRLNFTNSSTWDSVLSGSTLERCVEYYRMDFAQLRYDLPDIKARRDPIPYPPLFERVIHLIADLRKGRDVDVNWIKFRRLVESESKVILSTFSSRWLVSICDTYADHAQSPVRRRNALAISLFMNMIRMSDTLFEDQDVRPQRVDSVRAQQLPLFDGLQTLHLDRQDTCLNLAKRLTRSLSEDEFLYELYLELIRRTKASDNLITRFQKRSARPDRVFPENALEIEDNYGIK